ncbi:alpha/beta hydrolase [Poseidonocella sedimentorum]|uniref:alpha/beta hydrolase n=1 Tax=Poseidonocella sedimentorum TaxID=871652 RepID=UPI0015A6ED70|nr:alpha/beta hydrolase [Poseidonocella sedimentorum]
MLRNQNDLPDHALDSLLAGTGPVIIMIHGYKYLPETTHCPFDTILSLAPRAGGRLSVSWPRHLGISEDAGCGIAFGWRARGSLKDAYGEAERAGAALARLIARISARAPEREIGVIAHSLGARVYLQALKSMPRIATRAVLMTAAEFQGEAQTALASPAGRLARVINITSRENDLFDWLFELCLPAPVGGPRALGQGLGAGAARWVDLQIDNSGVLQTLGALGYRVPAPTHRVCHWFPYMRTGLFDLYRDFFFGAPGRSFEYLASQLPAEPCRRWSRLLPRFQRQTPPPGPLASA